MPIKPKPKNPRVALKLPSRNADFIVHSQTIHDQMAANAKTLPLPSPALTVLQNQIDDLATKEALAKARTPGAVADRDASKLTLKGSLESERQYVETLCIADPANAITLAQDAGMTLRAQSTHTKPPLAVKAGGVSGTVTLTAKAVKGARQNQWQYSADGGKTWTDLPPTTRAKTSIANLTPATTVMVRTRVFTKAGLEDWGVPIPHVVQ